MIELTVVPDADGLAAVAADRFVALGTNAIAKRGRFVVALSGGSTPRPVYCRLADESQSPALDWSRVELLWGDERCVPPHHPDSNYRTAREALLDHLEIPAAHVHRIRGEIPPEQAASAYEAELADVLGEGGRFDLILLGLGSDGHTASLFPGTEALEEREQDVIAIYVEELDTWRVTLTLPVINEARHVLFLVAGVRKADALARVQAGEELPASLVRPTDGTLTWLVDQAAASAVRHRAS